MAVQLAKEPSVMAAADQVASLAGVKETGVEVVVGLATSGSAGRGLAAAGRPAGREAEVPGGTVPRVEVHPKG